MIRAVVLVIALILLTVSVFAQAPQVNPIPPQEIPSRFAPFVGVWNLISCSDDPKKNSPSAYQLQLSITGTTIDINEPYYFGDNGLVFHPNHHYVLISFSQLEDKSGGVIFDNLYFKEGGTIPAGVAPWRMSLTPRAPGLFGRFAQRGEPANTSTLFGYFVGTAPAPIPDDFITTHRSVCSKD